MSNRIVGRLRSLRRGLFALFVGLCTLLALVLVAIQIEQRLFRRRAEHLFAEVQSLELRKTPWQEAQARVQRWGSQREFDGPCNGHECSLTVTRNDFVAGCFFERNIFVKLDDYFRWRLRLTYGMGPFQRALYASIRAYMRVGGHPARVRASIGMRDGIVWSKGVSIEIETYAGNGPWTSSDGRRVQYTLLARAHSAPRIDFFEDRQMDSQLAFHPYYVIGRPAFCTICVLGWTKFTPYAAPADIRRLMQFDLSCLTRWHPCLDQNDIMPAAWSQYLAERSRLEATSGAISCPSADVEMVGRDSRHLASVEVAKFREKADSSGYREGFAKVRVLKPLKGLPDWRVGEIRDVPISLGWSKTTQRIQSGSHLILIAGWGPLRGMRIAPGFDCPALSVSESTLAQLRRGIAQDYGQEDSPMDNPQ